MAVLAAASVVSRLPVSARWYASALGLSVVHPFDEDDPQPSVRLARDGFRLDLLGVPAPWTHARHTTTGLVQLAFEVADLDSAVRRVVAFQTIAAGSRLLHAPRVDVEWGVRFATVTDPDGGVAQLVERIAAPSSVHRSPIARPPHGAPS